MSSFGARRKARVIKVSDEDEHAAQISSSDDGDAMKTESSKPAFGSRPGRKPFRQSGLRKTLSAADDQGSGDTSKVQDEDEDEDDGPAVVRPNINRSGSSKKRMARSSKLSFGEDVGDEEEGDTKPVKKAPLGKRALENNATRRGVSTRGLPVRSFQDDDDRPKYSKEYLEELQSSTPNTPKDVSTLNTGDEMDLDSSELDGAMIVDSPDMPSQKPQTTILTEAEIREKKERRARLAKEQDFLSVEDDDEDEDRLGQKKKDDTRLKAEDEDLGEGFDDYVEDGGLSLGKRAERERRKRDRQQMAELITAAEGHTSDSSSDSDAERRMAYEAAQSRAGMDGLKKPRKDPAEELLKVPPKITPLPSLPECIQKLQVSLKNMEDDIKGKGARVQQLRNDKDEIVKRETEVQALLDETGNKYQEAMGQGRVEDATVESTGPGAELVGERGLESIGTTPKRTGEEAKS